MTVSSCVRPSVRPQRTTRLKLDEFCGILYWLLLLKYVEKVEVGLIPDTLNCQSTLRPTQTDDYFVCLGTVLAMAPKVASDSLDTMFIPVTTVTDVPMVANATMVPTVNVLMRTRI